MPVRASEGDRARAIGVLKHGYVTGRLSTQTFEARVAIAHATRSRAVLRELLADLSARWMATHAVLSSWASAPRVGSPWATVLLSRWPHAVLVVGRARTCDLVFGDSSVSRRHACFERIGGCWHISDLGSTNGTFVDDVQIDRAPIRPGCHLRLGGRATLDVA
jgi:hypothetical protein